MAGIDAGLRGSGSAAETTADSTKDTNDADAGVIRESQQEDSTTKDSGENENSNERGSTVQESVQQLTPKSSPSQRKKAVFLPPPLPTSKSMPTVEMDGTRSAAIGRRLEQSFAGFPHEHGDTQQWPSQDVINASLQGETATPQRSYAGGETQLTNRTPYTLQSGDAGHINFDDYKGSSPSHDAEFLQDETQGPSQVQRTPAPLTRQLSDLLTSGATAKTPGFTQAFGFEKNTTMTGTQMFAQTQQPSSDLPLPHYSDAIDDRPEFEQPPSSPPPTLSSTPAMLRRPASAGGEPRSEVLTREAERKIKAEAKARELARLQQLADNFDDDELSEDTQLRNARARREKAAQWSDNDAWDRINAPARTGSRPSSARKARSNEPIDLRTPGTVRKNYDKLIEAPMQDEETDDDEELPEEPAEDIQHSEHDEPDADMGDDEQLPGENEDNEPDNGSVNDEYDELSGVIRASQANLEDHIEFGSVNGSVAHEDDMEMQDNEPEPDEQGSTKAGQDGVPHQHVPESTNRSTVADSQPMPDHLAPVQHPVPSSNVSRVPGSQYKAQEGQEMAAPTDENGGQAGASLQNGSIGEEEKIPSSPPLQNADNTIPDNSAEASLLMQKMLDQFQARTESTEDGSTVQPEIPESDLPEAVRSRPHTAEAAEQNESLQAPFSTARTHVSASAQSPNKASAAPSPIKPAQSQQSRSTDETPRKRAGVLHFSEMAKGQLKTNPSFESQNIIDDIDDVMNGVYTDGDKSFQQHMSSPERPRAKRPKLAHTSSSLSSSSLARPPPFRQEQSAADDGNQQPVNVAAKEVVRDEQTSFARPLKPEPVSDEQEQDGMDVDVAQPDEASAEIAESEIAAQSPPAALRESPSKANKLPTPTINSSPKDKNRQDTSDSVREREKAGRAAVSQLVSARSTASAKRAKPTTYGRPSRRKSSTATSKAKARARSTRQATPEDSEHGDEVETDSQPAEMAVDQTSADLLLQAEEDEADELAGGDADKVAAPERVFALFKGTPQNFYPATYLGGSADGMTYKIKFDDGTSTNIDTQHVRSLELRVGDIVKVDDPEMRRKNWRIAGFGGVARSQNDTELGTDVYGHTRLKVQVSHNRTSMAGPSSTPADDGEVKEILVNTIYITPTMWPQYKDRAFSPSSTSKSIGKRAETPSTRSHTPAVETPASRSRRAPAPGGKAKVSGSRPSHLRETSVAPSSSAGNSSGIFSHMAFAISFVQDSAEKAEVTQAIRGHGGTVLDVGFEELFELPSLDGAATTSPSKKSPRKQATEAGGLQLKERYKNIRFAACISDKHSRRAKYIQALALGLPTISGRWIIHCLDETRNSSLSNGEVTPISWDKYLLPAGESIFLGGSIRSRTLTPYAASTSDLTTTISSRANLLSGEGLLIVAPRKGGNKEEEKRKTFAFLTLALGAGQVKRVADFGAAKKLVADNEGVWKWIYADGSIFEDAKAEIFGGSGNGKTAGKKRKRSDDEDSSKMFATDGKVKLVNDEFVIQSLILGALVEE
ncbi:DNA repair protein crb2 [Pseudocercospora fuligena]|uniref:DNA repair protein crb2 n=1 Tax=Pseudocercospora fuligena TaxID=685502 RepID=A0A8H6RDQ0_9PEZI|nr:DNA repair protein crb2 [Pseudocercospora fuligena]